MTLRSLLFGGAGCLLLSFVAPTFLRAQGLSDVMLYSRMDPMGTARSTGLGGAMTSLGPANRCGVVQSSRTGCTAQ